MANRRELLIGAVVLFEALSCARRPDIAATPPTTSHVAVAPSSSSVELPAATPPPRPMPNEPFTLRDDRDRAIEVYPPLGKEPRAPIVVFLHATCMQPSSVCSGFGAAARDRGWLVCPSGNSTCYGEPDWHGPGPEKAAFLVSALAKVEAELATFVDDRPGVLIGWSRGAFAARDILDAALADASLSTRFRGLVLIAAHVTPDPARLAKLGIHRVVMASGDHDAATPTMKNAVSKLRAGGLDARFISLGKIGHAWPSDFETRMREPIAWAAGEL